MAAKRLPSRAALLLLLHPLVHMILLVLAVRLDQIGIGEQMERHRGSPRLFVSAGVVDGDVDVHMPDVTAGEALGDVRGRGLRMALRRIHPLHAIESDGVHY